MVTNFEYMVRLKASQEREGHKPMWVYYKFIEEHPQDIYPQDLVNLGKLLGYKEGWARIKQEEWLKDLKRIKRERRDFQDLVKKDRRYRVGKDLKANKEF